MSVASPVVQTWDGENRRIYLKQGVSDYYPIDDLYKEYRNQRKLDENFRKFNGLLKAEGNVPKGAGAFTPRYVVLLEGTKVVPYNETLQVNQLGDMITDDPDTDATLYDVSQLTVPKPIFIKPSEAETIQLNSKSIEFSSYDGGVTLDFINGVPGTEGGTGDPIGTRLRPSNNEADAYQIAITNGFKKIYVIGDAVIEDPNVSWQGFQFQGENSINSLITIDPDADVFNCKFLHCTVTGTLDGTSQIEDGVITGLDFVDGYIYRCSLGPNNIELGTSSIANIFSSYSAVPGSNTPEIDMNGTGILALRDYNGGILLKNYTGSGSHSIDLASGQVKMDMTTITGGTFICRGVGKLIDAATGERIESGTYGNVTIVNELLDSDKLNLLLAIAEGDVIPRETIFKILHKTTKEELVVKDAVVNVDGFTELTE